MPATAEPTDIAIALLGGAPTDRRIAGLLATLPHVESRELDPWIAAILSGADESAAGDPAALARLTGLIDLTSLSPDDTDASVAQVALRAVAPDERGRLPHTAAVCVHADLVPAVRAALDQAAASGASDADGVALAAVAGGFPHGRVPWGLRAAEVEYVVAAGADEVDIVIDRGALLAGRFAEVYQWVAEARQRVQRTDGSRALLKVILETGELPSLDLALHAAIIALLGGADFVKTSTGKGRVGATVEATAVLAQAVSHWGDETDVVAGVKISGGVRTVEQAAGYITVIESLLGGDAITPERLRFGASGLLDDIARHLDPVR